MIAGPHVANQAASGNPGKVRTTSSFDEELKWCKAHEGLRPQKDLLLERQVYRPLLKDNVAKLVAAPDVLRALLSIRVKSKELFGQILGRLDISRRPKNLGSARQ